MWEGSRQTRFRAHRNALAAAWHHSRREGVRYRVIRQDHPAERSSAYRFLIAPTPAPAPSAVEVSEPVCNGICVMASELIECAPNVVAHAHPDCDLHGYEAVSEPCS